MVRPAGRTRQCKPAGASPAALAACQRALSPDQALGRAFREERVSRELTQQEVARLSGLQRKTIHQFETGKCDCRVGTVRRLTVVLDMTLAELFERADELLSDS